MQFWMNANAQGKVRTALGLDPGSMGLRHSARLRVCRPAAGSRREAALGRPLRERGEYRVQGLHPALPRLQARSLRQPVGVVPESLEIGRVKQARGLPVHIPDRESELLDVVREEARHLGLDVDHVVKLFELVLAESRRLQHDMRSSEQSAAVS